MKRWLQKIITQIFGYCFLEKRQPAGFNAPTKFYLVRCRKHGYFEDYAHGYWGYFDCPKCREEAKVG